MKSVKSDPDVNLIMNKCFRKLSQNGVFIKKILQLVDTTYEPTQYLEDVILLSQFGPRNNVTTKKNKPKQVNKTQITFVTKGTSTFNWRAVITDTCKLVF